MAPANRYLLDSNMVLNAAFIEKSWARRVVEIAYHRKFAILVGKASLRDAHRRALALAAGGPRGLQAAGYVDSMLRRLGAVVVDPAAGVVHAAIPMHDAHVVQEAAAADATIVTMDRELWLACREAKVTAILPMEVFDREYGMSLGMISFGVMPTPKAGTLFAKGNPGPWPATGTRHTFLDFPGFAWLGYDTTKQGWVAEFAGLDPLVLPAPRAANQFETVSVSWLEGDQLRLRASSVDHPVQRPMLASLPGRVPERYWIGSTSKGTDYWNSTLWVCICTDRPIGRELWRDCKQHHHLVPNPFDDDRLAAAVRLWATG